MIDNVIFDWSGVINDNVESYLCVANKILEKFGSRKISLEELKENWEQPYMRFYNKYLPDLTIEEEQPAYKVALSECPKGRPYPGISVLLKEFKKAGIRMTVLSSDFPETLLPEIKKFNLEDVFIDVITSVHDKSSAIREIMARNDFRTEKTIFVGDSNHEIEVGKNIGVKTGAVTWGFSTEARLRLFNPDFIIHNLDELKSTILGN